MLTNRVQRHIISITKEKKTPRKEGTKMNNMMRWEELNKKLNKLNSMNEIEFTRNKGKETKEKVMEEIRKLENEILKDLEW